MGEGKKNEQKRELGRTMSSVPYGGRRPLGTERRKGKRGGVCREGVGVTIKKEKGEGEMNLGIGGEEMGATNAFEGGKKRRLQWKEEQAGKGKSDAREEKGGGIEEIQRSKMGH